MALIYGCWMWFDRSTDSCGGRWSQKTRRLWIWSKLVNYFPMTLVKTAELDPNKNYIFGFHPHGFLPFGAFGNFATEATNFSKLFPKIRPHLMLLRLQFLFPFSREVILNLGSCCVSRRSCEFLLNGSAGSGNAAVIILGGIREMKLKCQEKIILYLRSRKGFVELALKNGASLVPVLSFGENQLYRDRPFTWGRNFLGHVPFRRSLFTIVGKPIHVGQIKNPTTADINRVHDEYLRSIEQLFHDHKNDYNIGNVQLEII